MIRVAGQPGATRRLTGGSVFVSLNETTLDEDPSYSAGLRVRAYLGSTHSQFAGEVGPQAFLVEVDADGDVIRPHFHPTRQFQIVAKGGGRIGKRPVEPFAFHYVDPLTPYGPIVQNDEGIWFFTLRADHTAETGWMPEDRDEIENPGRNLVATVPQDDAELGLKELIDREDDGLAAYNLRIAPGETADGPPPTGSGGQYYIVTSGSIVHEGREYGPLSLAFVSADDKPPRLTAGDDGAAILINQFPVLAEGLTEPRPIKGKASK
jgi:hypothetical protein